MNDLIEKKELAKFFKVSLPVISKYLKYRKGVIKNGMVDIKKLVEDVNKESLSKLSKKGK